MNVAANLIDSAEACCDAYLAGENSPTLLAEMFITLKRMTRILKAQVVTEHLEESDESIVNANNCSSNGDAAGKTEHGI